MCVCVCVYTHTHTHTHTHAAQNFTLWLCKILGFLLVVILCFFVTCAEYQSFKHFWILVVLFSAQRVVKSQVDMAGRMCDENICTEVRYCEVEWIRDYMRWVCNTVGGSKEYVDSLVENMNRKGHFGSTNIDGKVKLKVTLDRGII